MLQLHQKTDWLSLSWILIIFGLFIYSFTQIDLGLTLTQLSVWQVIQRNFQYIGYFNRPLSTLIYLFLVIILFILYYLIIKSADRFGIKKIWQLIIITAIFLWLSYNAFSYDLFNYIFDAKIFTYYHLNPYIYKALDFSNDPMLGFMHWTHRVYPYGPVWLAITIPLSYLGFQKLLLTIYLFKGVAALSYLLSCWSIYKILEKINPTKKITGLVLFAFNPLVIIESLVSAHNDIVMLALVLWAFVLVLNQEKVKIGFGLLLSIGIKFATGILAPIFLYISIKKESLNSKLFLYCGLLMLVVFIAVSLRTELQPWYLLYLLPFVVLADSEWFFWPVMILSFGLLLHYVPYLFAGNWDPPLPMIKNIITYSSVIIGLIIALSKRKTKSML